MPVPRPFQYHAPTSIDEAIRLATEGGDQAKFIAGGQSLLPLMRFRLVSPAVVVDIGKHLGKELSFVWESVNGVSIGALSTHYQISTSEVLKSKCPMLAKAALDIGDYQVRNRGTVGGSLCHADPAAHYPPAVLALDGELVLRGKAGERVIRAVDFFKDLFTTAIGPDEILTEIRLPTSDWTGWGYEVIHGQGGSFATAIVAALLRVNRGRCESARIVVGACTSVPARLVEAEEVLLGKEITPTLILQASAAVRSHLKEPLVDLRVRANYRREMAALATRRALSAAGGL